MNNTNVIQEVKFYDIYLDNFLHFFNKILSWFPWLNFYTEDLLMQNIFIIIFFLLLNSRNSYYLLFYFLLIVFNWSVILANYNLEVLTGFLLVVELTAFLVLLLFLLSINYEGKLNNNKNSLFAGWFFSMLFFLFFLFLQFRPYFFKDLNPISYWDDYYDALNTESMNDLTGLYLFYYSSHIPIFILFIFLIFIASLICVNIGIISKIQVKQSVQPLRDVFNFMKDLLAFNFKRTQNSYHQQKRKATTRFVNSNKPEAIETEEEKLERLEKEKNK